MNQRLKVLAILLAPMLSITYTPVTKVLEYPVLFVNSVGY